MEKLHCPAVDGTSFSDSYAFCHNGILDVHCGSFSCILCLGDNGFSVLVLPYGYCIFLHHLRLGAVRKTLAGYETFPLDSVYSNICNGQQDSQCLLNPLGDIWRRTPGYLHGSMVGYKEKGVKQVTKASIYISSMTYLQYLYFFLFPINIKQDPVVPYP